MAVGCGAKCAKAVLITFNFVFWLSGCALLGLGIWLLVDPQKTVLFDLVQLDGHEPMMKYLAYGLIGVGGFILLVGIIGCCGAIQENKCLLITYFITLFIVLGAEVSIGVLAVLYRTQLLSELEEGLTKKLKRDYGINGKEAFTSAMDFTQFKFKCCGVMSGEDYNNSTWRTLELEKSNDKSQEKLSITKTCCVLKSDEWDAWKSPEPRSPDKCMSDDTKVNIDDRYQAGCKDSIQQWFKDESLILIAVGLGVAGLEIFGMIFAICLCRSLGEREA